MKTSPGQVVEDLKNIRQSLQSFIDMKSKLEAKVKRVLQANDLTLLITEWSINGTKPEDKSINLTGRGTVVLRRQSDGNWLIVIENPWGDRSINAKLGLRKETDYLTNFATFVGR